MAKVRVKRAAKPAGESNGAILGAVERAIRDGVSKPAEIVRQVGDSTIAVRRALKELVSNGVARAEGATMSRRYYLAGVPAPRARQAAAPAKEAVR